MAALIGYTCTALFALSINIISNTYQTSNFEENYIVVLSFYHPAPINPINFI